MRQKQVINLLRGIAKTSELAKKQVFAEVLRSRRYEVGDLLRRKDGLIITIVGFEVFLYTPDQRITAFPNVHYWGKLEKPAGFNTKIGCDTYKLANGKAQDFWEGDKEWRLIKRAK